MSADLALNQLQPNMSSFNTTVIVLDPGGHRRTHNGTITTMKVADSTGSINVSLMNPEFTETFRAGDILKFRGAHTTIFQGGLTLSVGKNGECKKVSEFMMVFSETPDISQMPLPAGVTDRRSDERAPRQQQQPLGGNRYSRP
ncbi:hypothetical protein CRE_28736 [Caenorhabditis remanei]|uniref:Uncharacterized protein n=2 Tax=Caenorhabditis remanei TaxID=31234 RepID=E3MK90_CAERE|nr:hypothetical protein CRE_28736 [Caenorhabditis remanei]